VNILILILWSAVFVSAVVLTVFLLRRLRDERPAIARLYEEIALVRGENWMLRNDARQAAFERKRVDAAHERRGAAVDVDTEEKIET
jgi:hypothetical protein